MGIRESIDALVAAFNRGSLDVPAGLFTSRTRFSLNNRSYESILGGSAERGGSPAIEDDPLIRMLSRGAAGYRTAAKALQYALQSPVVTIESLSEPDGSGVCVGTLRVEGQLRNTFEPFDARASLRITGAQLELTSVEVFCQEEELARIAASRRA